MPGGAGPVSLGDGPAVDVPTAKEFIDEVHRAISREELGEIVSELQRKATGFAERLSGSVLPHADAAAFRSVLRSTFVARRHVSTVLGSRSDVELREWVGDLLHGDDPLAERFDRFCASAGLEPLPAAELASELLHYTRPDRYWLWTRWIWSPESRTGALPLVVNEEYDLEDVDGPGATYERVGLAMAAVDRSPEAASFRPEGGGRLGTDLFLVCVYGIYMNTVLGLKMTQEFNEILPPLPQLARRFLGTHRMEV